MNTKAHSMTLQEKRAELWRRIKKYRLSYAFIAPFMLIFLTFTFAPVLISLVYSFTSFNILEDPQFILLDNYRRLLTQDPLFFKAFKNTLVLAAITGPISYMLCLILAWFLNDFGPKVRSGLTLLFYAPTLANIYFVWQLIFSGDAQGLFNAYLLKLGMISEPIQWLTDEKFIMPVLIFVLLWSSLGTSFLVLIAGFQNVDSSLYEAAAVDGIHNRWQELWYITLPYMKPQLMFAAVTSITGAFSIAGAIDILCGSPSTNYVAWTIMNHLNDYGGIRMEMGYACTIAVALFAIMVVTNQFFQKLLGKVGD